MVSTTRTRRRSRTVAVGAAAVIVTGMTGCGSADEAGICVDRQTQQRVDDDVCDDDGYGGSGTHGWYYIPRGGYAPGVGSRATGGSWVPSGSVQRGGVDRSGETIDRGGFRSGSRPFGG